METKTVLKTSVIFEQSVEIGYCLLSDSFGFVKHVAELADGPAVYVRRPVEVICFLCMTRSGSFAWKFHQPKLGNDLQVTEHTQNYISARLAKAPCVSRTDSLARAMKAQRGNRGIAVLFL